MEFIVGMLFKREKNLDEKKIILEQQNLHLSAREKFLYETEENIINKINMLQNNKKIMHEMQNDIYERENKLSDIESTLNYHNIQYEFITREFAKKQDNSGRKIDNIYILQIANIIKSNYDKQRLDGIEDMLNKKDYDIKNRIIFLTNMKSRIEDLKEIMEEADQKNEFMKKQIFDKVAALDDHEKKINNIAKIQNKNFENLFVQIHHQFFEEL